MRNRHALSTTKRYQHFILLWIALLLFTACDSPNSGLSAPDIAAPTLEMTPDTEELPVEATLVPQPTTQAQAHLSPEQERYPDIFITPSHQNIDNLATYLNTTAEQLRRTNPHLNSESVPRGTMLALPIAHYASAGETLLDVAEQTRLPIDHLSVINPDLGAAEPLASDTFISVPALLIVAQTMSVDDLSEQLAVDTDDLLSANLDVNFEDDQILGGTVLVPPLVEEVE